MALVRISFEIRRNVSHSEREKICLGGNQGAGQCFKLLWVAGQCFNMSVGRGAVS